ncbi:hypothetical protein [Peribacillus sp. NPDC097295]|uniref:hypothetical protein n=1 Tax=Peribacillus sp. NPDC097295 TaxID=3364402 RepID=UPI0037F57641
MPSRITSFNRELIFYIFRSSGWIGFLYFIGLIFALPLEILTIILNDNSEYMNFVNLFSSQQMIQFVLVITIPVLLAIFLFRFLHVKQASDFLHSLPITRRSIYFHMIGMGIVFIILPILLTGSVLGIFHSALDVEKLYNLADIGSWMGITFLMEGVIFSVAVLIGMVTGLSSLQGLLTYITLGLPAGLFILLIANARFLLKGFYSEYYLNAKMNSISPLLAATEMEKLPFFSFQILIYAIVVCLFLWLSLILYERRKLEHVSQAFVFPMIKPIFKYGLTTCMMLFAGFYFSQSTGKMEWVLVGYVVGSMIGYYLGDLVLQKTWRIKVSLRGYAIFAVAVITVVIILKLDPVSFESKVPDKNMINHIYIGNYSPLYDGDDETEKESSFLKEKENISAIRLLHQQILEKGKMESLEETNPENSVFLIYELENGRRLAREYHLKNYEAYLPLLAKIYESSEYKHMVNELLNVPVEEVYKLKIDAMGELDKSVTIADRKQSLEAVQALSEDLNNQTLAQMTQYWGEYAYIEILLENNKTIYMNWNSSYPAFTNWMEKTGQADEARLTVDDISHILVAKSDLKLSNLTQEEIEVEIEKQPVQMRIDGPVEIDSVIENSRINYGDGDYVAVIYYKDSRDFEIRSFSSPHVPSFISDYFK